MLNSSHKKHGRGSIPRTPNAAADNMLDPHVEKVHFEIGCCDRVSYQDPEPLQVSNHLGTFSLHNGNLEVTPLDHYANADGALQAIEPYLRAWEIEADLRATIGVIRFKFLKADIIDRRPHSRATQEANLLAGTGTYALQGQMVSMQHNLRRYPLPPTMAPSFAAEAAHSRWVGHFEGKEPLQSMAYFVLTALEKPAGGRSRAARTFGIDMDVLDTYGELTSTRGDGKNLRKFQKNGVLRDLTAEEKTWLYEAVKAIIRRLGEHASGAPLKQITMADLPAV
jgi:hypothetical protein